MSAKILIIEDSEDISKVLAKRFTAAGYEVLTSPDATLATQQAHSFHPNLIILDLMLPGGGGLFILKKLKMSTFTNSIPVIVLTASQDETLKRQVLEAGVSAFLQKPYEAEELLAQASRLLGN